MRIVAGEFKGRRLAGPPDNRARPTSDKVREALFSILGDVSGLVVLDLFAGTGALALEALSRGAGRAVLVERDQRVMRVARANAEAVLGDQAVRAELLQSDARTFLTSGRDSLFDLVLIDPPYAQAEEFAPVIVESLPKLLAPSARIVVESDRRSPPELPAETFVPRSEHRYGDTLLRIFDAP
jgi:16S rRNA (guanine966-N2)-methyltransferase